MQHLISLIPATAGDRCDIKMSQQISQTAQERIDELVWRTQEKEEARKKKKKEFQVGEASSNSQECPSGQETTNAMSTAGCTVLIRGTKKGDESVKIKKTNDKLGQEEEIDVEGQEEIDVEEQGKATVRQESGSADDDDKSGDEPSVVEFEDTMYELSQTYKMEPEYESMTLEQEAMEVQALAPAEQAKYRELTRLHQHQAEIEKKMTGMSKVIKERTKAWTPGLPVDLMERKVKVEPAEKQELHWIMGEQKVWASIKQDEIPRMDRLGTSRGYYLFVEDDAGCMVEQQGERIIRDTDTEQHLLMDLITEEEATTYQVPGQDNQMIDDDAETISSTSTADYDHEEVETSLTNISKAFHTIAQEHEKLTSTVPHMSKIQAAQVIVRLATLPAPKQEMKIEKTETVKTTEAEPMPGTSRELPAAEAEKPAEEPMEEVMVESAVEEKEDEPKEENVNEYFKKYVLTRRAKAQKRKFRRPARKLITEIWSS